MKEISFDNIYVTLGTDYEKQFAWCIRYVNNVKCICLYKRNNGMSTYSESDYITAIPVEKILSQIDRID